MNYNQDFEAAKNWYKLAKEQNNQQAIDILEQLFPKLKDIYIVDTLVSICNIALPDIFKKYGCDKDDVLEWLNSQYDKNMSLTDILNNDIPKRKATGVLKEMIDEANNTTYKPKFSKGDYIIRNTDGYIHNTYCIKDVMDDYYVCTELSCRYNVTLSFEEVNNTFKLWDISDAKDGDILATDKSVFIYAKTLYNKPYAYCGVDKYGVFKDNCLKNNWANSVNNMHPATKEQCDTLFAKMKEDGYEWDDEKKKVKKIEDEEYDGEDYGIDGLWHAQRILEKTLGKVNGYQTDDGILDHKVAIDTVKKLYEQKPAWSEEDTFMYNKIKNLLTDISLAPESRNSLFDWLKSLKERVQPKQEWKQENTSDLTDFENAMIHIGSSFFGENAGLDPNDTSAIKEQANLLLELVPKTEWSEEDEKTLNEIFSVAARASLRKSTLFGKSYDYIKWQNWLKSLRDRVQQPKHEWSEEDEHRINCISDFIWKNRKGDTDEIYQQEQDVNWLKSLKDRYTLKPSKG